MSLLFAFDDINARGNDLIYKHLAPLFPAILLPDNGDFETHIKDNRGAKCLFTTSSVVAQLTSHLVPTILYINDPYEGISSRHDNISGWRQSMSMFKGLDSIFVASSSLATSFLNTYRIPCRVQYPFVPKSDISNPNCILYNKTPSFINQMLDFVPHEMFMMYNSAEDFREAKLYIHIPEPGEQWHLNIMLAHAHGVPCITYQQGCFSEFCTTGDKMLPVGSDVRTWMNNFKVAMRDHAINSKIVYDMSQRFHEMNEIQQRIKRALLENGMVQTPPTFAEVQEKASGVDALKRLQQRRTHEQPTFTQRVVRPQFISRANDYSMLTNYLNNNTNIYAGVGGIGDALMILATSLTDPHSKIVFGANGGVKDTVKQLFDAFNKETLMVQNFNGSPEGVAAWNSILDHHNFKSCAHIPRDLNYGDWNTNSQYYLEKSILRVPLVRIIGKLVNPRATKKVIGLAPRGSDHNSTWKQRYLTRDEYHQIVKKLLTQKATILVFGSEDDLNYYGVYPDNNVIFMNSSFAVSHPAPKYPITMRHMLTAVNSCDEIISVDTWLKTYAGLAGIPCKVIMNRFFGKSSVDHMDASDRIFLDPLVWGFEMVALERLL
jgi:hypothetical protein